MMTLFYGRHGLLVLVELASPDVERIYKGIIEDEKLEYLNSWGRFHGHLSSEARGVTVDAQPGVKVNCVV